MPLQYEVSNLDELDEGVRSLYKENGDTFVLDVDGAVNTNERDKLVANNAALVSEKKALKDKFAGVDLDQYNVMQEQSKALADKKLLDSEGIDAVLKQKMAEVAEAHNKELDAAKQYKNMYESELLTKQLGVLADAAGVKSDLKDYVIMKGKEVFSLEGGKLVAKNPDGTDMYDTQKPTEALTPESFLNSFTRDHPSVLKGSTGGGAGGGNGATTKSTISRTNFDNLSPADKVASAKAGVKVVD